MEVAQADRPLLRSSRLGRAFLYGFFGLLVLVGGWFLGSLYLAAVDAPMAFLGAVIWWFGLMFSLPLLALLFLARPARTPHRWAWAVAVAVGYFGFFRVWSWWWSVVAAVLSIALLVIPRRPPRHPF